MIKYSGDDNGLTAAIDYLYRDWVNANDITLRNYPLFLERLDINDNKLAQHEPRQALSPQQVLIYLPVV
ncbi:MAG: AraC family transcriptional regulator [Cellvibrionaceae bacterium]|jgi:AraC family transcriptional regulator